MPKTKLKFKKKSKASQVANLLFEDINSAKDPQTLDLKERLAQKRKAREDRRKIFTVLGISIVFAILVALPLGIAVTPKIGSAVAIGFPVLLLCFNYPRMALWAFLIYMPFSGTVTYWIGQGNALFQLSKDAFYVPALIGLVIECRRRKLPILIPKKILPSLGLLLFCALLTLFFVNGWQQTLTLCSQVPEAEEFLRDAAGNLLLDSRGIIIRAPCKDGGIPFLQGILGLKVLLGYIPLIFCTYYLIEDKKRLLLLGRILVLIAIVCCSLAMVQYWMLKTGRCVGTREMAGIDLFKPNLDAKCLVGGAVLYSPEHGQIRLPGTFVSPWHWAWFLVANAAICYATAFSDTSFLWRTTGLVGMGLVFVNAVICGQRLALALVPAVIIVLLVLTGQVANLKRFIPAGIGLVLVLFVAFSFINPDFVQQRIDSFVNRWNQAPPYAFIQSQFDFALGQQRGILGRGVGKATNSTRVFGPVSLVETFHPKLLFEMGFPGLIAFMIFITHLTVLCFKSYRPIKDRALRSFGSSLWVFMLIIGYFPYWYPLDTDPVAVYYWLFAGVVLKLSDIDKQEQAKLQGAQDDAKNKRSPLKKKKFAAASS
ncbi:MAG: hormogonium polysaccharide biosynthesis protein HpsL [Hydrococcus sp. Prado102]|jgi:cell division protein FtsW (lipid II flippase)|nr:hormogonium polysaccharide biosynthesis protein HpsL [Hydrococcus sp. Prado102]